MVTRYPKGSRLPVAVNFRVTDFDCPCSQPLCHTTIIDTDLVELLQVMREALDFPLIVDSGYRCHWYQEDLKLRGYETAEKSMHLVGAAADVRTGKHSGVELERVARRCGIRAIGVGRRWIHVDTRDERDRSWSYVKR